MEVGLHGGRPRPWPHCVRWGPSPSPIWAQLSPNFRPMSVVAKRLDVIKVPLGREVDLGPGYIVLDEDPAPHTTGHSPPIFGLCLLCQNGWMDQDATWDGGRPWPRPLCVRWRCSPPPRNRHSSPPSLFGPCLL